VYGSKSARLGRGGSSKPFGRNTRSNLIRVMWLQRVRRKVSQRDWRYEVGGDRVGWAAPAQSRGTTVRPTQPWQGIQQMGLALTRGFLKGVWLLSTGSLRSVEQASARFEANVICGRVGSPCQRERRYA
jgi:hypothetical protein